MSQEKKREVHPIVKKALKLAHKGTEPVEFDEAAIEELKLSLEQYFGQPDLLNAVVDLINLAGLLQEQGSPTAAVSIMEVVSTAADALKGKQKKEKKEKKKKEFTQESKAWDKEL